ncbi:hypothetical protein HOE37_00095 [Candidatus Woesearchaeota archaeon]|jgi:hypothetical protein|nr:hypothetical protein [Candidatus Woesearchaeota archaeon]MBT4110237.1 hypothetical protein [Candidatus Woesearchaeota archaeon]MBT4336239.1 hypothetical protein [Candidatus Woesearchaeota archaeon]MBT4468782.1 hypothetical protein [Candidatus Woesearchaeota archaeon]MBT6744899.1 hypothetical protein [Candidatus Woesearchaeota archaeon]
MKKLISLFFVLSLFLVSSVTADMMPAGHKSVRYTFEIENIADYPDHVFILYGEIGTREILEPGQEVHFYKYSSPYIYAIKKTDFDLKNFEQLKEGDYKVMENYFETNPDLIKSDLQLTNYGMVSEFDPLDKAKDVLKIKLLDENNLLIVKDKVIYTYEDGTSEEKVYGQQGITSSLDHGGFPVPSRTTIFPPWTMSALFLSGFLLSLSALILIIVLVVRRIRR